MKRNNYEGERFSHKKYGEYLIVEHHNSEKAKIRFLNTGYEYYATIKHIRDREVKDRLFVNKYGLIYGGRQSNPVAYKCWYNMIMRCSSRDKSYLNCEVCEEWLNFSKFNKWFQSQYRQDGWHLDKDIRMRGNKIYSPDTCCFIPSELNTFFEKHIKAKGYGMNRNKSKFVAYIRNQGAKIHIGTFNTEMEARMAYLSGKKNLLMLLIDKYSNCLEGEIKTKMIEYIC